MKNYWIKRNKNSIVENQRLCNKLITKKPPNWDGISIMAAEHLRDCVGLQLVSSQIMLGPTGRYQHKDKDNNVVDCPITAKTRRLACPFFDTLPQDIASEVSREIIIDLRNNVGFKTIHDGKNKEIQGSICSLFDKICENTTHQGRRWIVTSPEIANSVFDLETKYVLGPYHATKTNEFDIYVDPLFPLGDILLGQVTEGVCYTYNPFIPVSFCTISEMNVKHFITRYSKNLPADAEKNYAKLTIKDFTRQ